MAYRCIMGAWRHFWSDDRLHAFGRDKVRPIGPPLNDAAASGPPASAPIIIFRWILFAILVLGMPLLMGTAARIFNDGDTSWHIAAGQWILEHRQIPMVDPFSFTMAGKAWTAHEWLAEIMMAGAFQTAGFAGIASLVTLALTLLHLIIYRRAGPPISPAITFFSFIGLALVLAPYALARPHVLVWPLMALWTSILLDAADAKKSPPWWLPLLMILWVNVHGSFILGLVIYGAISLEALLSRDIRIGRWILVGLASAIATLVNANGVEALLFPFTVGRMETLHLIQEWGPTTFSSTPFFFSVVAGATAAAIWKRRQIPLVRLLLLLFLLIMALLHIRHQAWFAIAAALIIPSGFRGDARDVHEAKGWSLGRAAFIAALIPATLALLLPIRPNEGPAYPVTLLAAVPPELRTQPVFNEYSFGGPLILAGIRPYIDGRADMYGDAFFLEYTRIRRGDFALFTQAANQHGIRWTMLQHANAKLIEALDASPAWRRLATDKVGVIHVRR
jgi:hypothetical protein